jgi:predicted nucleic acid-binding protein
LSIIVQSMNDRNVIPPKDELIIVDTCVLLEIWGNDKNQRYKAMCEKFIKKATAAKSILCITIQTYEELHYFTQRNEIPRDKSIFNLDKTKYLNNSNIIVNRIMNELNKIPSFYTEPIGNLNAKTLNEIEANQIKHGLKWGDAAIYTYLKQEDARYILSIDGDFLGIQDPNIVLYTTPYRARLANSTNNINITGNTNVKNPYPSKNLNTTQ